MPAKQKSDERRVKKWNEVINRQSLIIENYENELKEEKEKNRHLIGHLTILKTSAIISPLPQKKKLLKEVPVLKFDSDDEEENKKETLKPTQEQQPPPNPIKEVFIDESVEEEEENEQEKPKEKKKGKKRKSRPKRMQEKREKKAEKEGGHGKLQLSVCYNTQQGSLFVTIRRCVGLLGMDGTGSSNPYCKVSLLPLASKAHRQKTAIKEKTSHPEFNETMQFLVPFKDLPNKTLAIGVYDSDMNGHDDCIGGVVLATEATGERGIHWQKMIQKPGKNSQYWHKLDVDE
uniref:C2 domain-containing protein n=1 Tax=Meloidogyne incognita TaxID=6306 RepID=A0A914KTB5_MELIC